MTIEELKKVDLTLLKSEKEHKEEVLKLNHSDLKEYLNFAIDTFYKTEEEGENNEVVKSFFSDDRFKPVYEELMAETEAETEAEDISEGSSEKNSDIDSE